MWTTCSFSRIHSNPLPSAISLAILCAGASSSGSDAAFHVMNVSPHMRLSSSFPPRLQRASSPVPTGCLCSCTCKLGPRPSGLSRLPLHSSVHRNSRGLSCARLYASEAEISGKSKYAARFDKMLLNVQGYSLAQVMCLEDEVTRKIITGLVEGSKVPEVEEAFRILYEDYPPIRLAGNLLFDMIQRAIESCPIIEFGDSTDPLTETALQNARNLFTIADVDGSGHLDQGELRSFLDQLATVGWTIAVDQDKFLQGSSRGVSFAAFATGAQDFLRLPAEEQETIMQRLSEDWQREGAAMGDGGGHAQRRDAEGAEIGAGWGWRRDKQDKYNARFEDMIQTVESWRAASGSSLEAPTISSVHFVCSL